MRTGANEEVSVKASRLGPGPACAWRRENEKLMALLAGLRLMPRM